MKKQEGITLIALVITIIVLLILAGVTIAMLSGENGILTRASEASLNSKFADAEDMISVNVAEHVTNYYNKTYVNSSATGESTLNEAIAAGVNGATLPSGITIDTFTAGDTSIVIKNTSAGKQVTGTISGSSVTWGAISNIE
ncbi:MAG: hypothetical protein IKF17_01230 [Clostridia bacterium]|nr:hypothetical protein [Clostridia bacterium]